jgi:hypothetical protein
MNGVSVLQELRGEAITRIQARIQEIRQLCEISDLETKVADERVLQWSYTYSVGETSRKPLHCPHPANSTETDAGFRMAMPSMGGVGVLARAMDPPIYLGYMPRHVFGSAARRIMGYTATWHLSRPTTNLHNSVFPALVASTMRVCGCD